MPHAASRDPLYRRRRYSPELIEQWVRCYLTYRLSYRDLTAMMAERDLTVSHTTIMRWVRHMCRSMSDAGLAFQSLLIRPGGWMKLGLCRSVAERRNQPRPD